MKKLTSLILTYLMSTTLVFSQHTKSNIDIEIQKTISIIKDVKDSKTKSCTPKEKNKLLKKIDRRIRRAYRKNESLETSVYKVTKKFNRFKNRQIRKTNKILRKQRRINRVHRKLAQHHPEMTKDLLVEQLKHSIDPTTIALEKDAILNKLVQAGSMENFLLDAKDFIEQCEKGYSSIEGGDTWGLVLLILFVGTPILALLISIFALIFGAFNLALILFIYTIVMAGVLVLMSNIGKDKLNDMN